MTEPLRDVAPQDGEIKRPELILLPGQEAGVIGHIANGGSVVVELEPLTDEDEDGFDIGDPADYMPPRRAGGHWTMNDDYVLKMKTGRTRQLWL